MVKKQRATLSNGSTRDIAVNALVSFRENGRYIQDFLNEAFGEIELSLRDRRLAMELSLGSCRRLISLDHLISKYSTRPLRKINPLVLDILRVGLYQLIFLNRLPDFAAVSEAVRQGRATGIAGVDGFINAVLRGIQRDIDKPTSHYDKRYQRSTLWLDNSHALRFKKRFLPDPVKNTEKYFSLAYAHPRWLVKRWLDRYDSETVRNICITNNSRPILSLRANILRCQGVALAEQLEQASYQAFCHNQIVQLACGAVPEQLPGYAEGMFSVQDATAAAVVPILGVKSGWRVLDMCAGPGGKTTHLAELMGNSGEIVACDITAEKLDLVVQNCRRLGIEIVRTSLARELDSVFEHGGAFDAILLDVPCSNTGVLARRVEARHKLSGAGISDLLGIQRQLLEKAAVMLKSNGKLLYSTCSIEHVENDLQISNFLHGHPSFELVSESLTLPSAGVPASDDVACADCELWHDGGYTALLKIKN